MPEKPEFRQRLQSIERLLATIESAADPHLRAAVQDLMQATMSLHGEGLERMLELIRTTAGGGPDVVARLGRDELVGSLLVLYGLHPLDLETRLAHALDKARSRLRARSGSVELVSVEGGAVRLRVQGGGQGCGSDPQALKQLVEDFVFEAAPDITSLAIDGPEEKQGFVPVEMLMGAAR